MVKTGKQWRSIFLAGHRQEEFDDSHHDSQSSAHAGNGSVIVFGCSS